MLRLILLYIFVIPILLFSSFNQTSVFAEANTSDSKSVAEHMKSQEESEKQNTGKSSKVNDLAPENAAEPFSIFTFIKMIFALILVVFLIYFLLRFINKKGNPFNQYRYIQNVGGTSLGQNRSIQLVKAGKRILVVGVGDSIQLLKEIENEDEIQEILADHNHKQDQLVQSKDLLVKLFKKRVKQTNQVEKSNHQFGYLLKEQLQELTKGRKKTFEQIENEGNKQHE